MATIKVWPGDATASSLSHPVAGALKGRPGGDDWPADQFTFRRIQEGAIRDTAPDHDIGHQRAAAIAKAVEAPAKK